MILKNWEDRGSSLKIFVTKEPESDAPGQPVRLSRNIWFWFLGLQKVFSDYQNDNPETLIFLTKESESDAPGWPVRLSRSIWFWFLGLKMLFRIIKMIIRNNIFKKRNQNQVFLDNQFSFLGTSDSDPLVWKCYFGLSFR